MNPLVVLTLLGLACTQASIISYVPLPHPVPISIVGPPEPGTIVQGPSSKATVTGPDGSTIIGSASGGAIVAPPKPGPSITASVSPGVIAPILPIVPKIAPAIIVAHPPPAIPPPIPSPPQVLIAGPSGTIATGGAPLPVIGIPKIIYGKLW